LEIGGFGECEIMDRWQRVGFMHDRYGIYARQWTQPKYRERG